MRETRIAGSLLANPGAVAGHNYGVVCLSLVRTDVGNGQTVALGEVGDYPTV